MLIWNKDLIDNEHIQNAVALIPGACISKKSGNLIASDDLREILQKLVGHTPTYINLDRRNVSNTNLPNMLFPWQREAASALAKNEKKFVWFACGLGKSLAMLSACKLIDAQKILIVTRSMGKDVYARDCDKAGFKGHVAILMGLGKESKATDYALRRYNKYLSNRYFNCAAYGKTEHIPSDTWITVVPWEILHAHEAKLGKYDVIIFDEHHMGKGRLAKRTDCAIELSKRGDIKWSLTATPVADRLRDLWAQWKMIDYYGAGSSWTWCHRYCNARPGRYGGLDTSGVSNIEELKERLEHLAIVKTRQEVRHLLPSKMRNIIRIDAKGKLEKFSYEIGITGVESAIAYASNLKIDEVVDRCIEGLAGREKIVLVGNRRIWAPKVYEKILQDLPNAIKAKAWIRWTTGEASVGERQKLADEYMHVHDCALLIGTIDSLGESIDLQDTDRLIIAALPYSPRQLIQIEGRVNRLGGNRPVTIDFLVCEGTIDEQIEEVLLSKLDTVESSGANTEISMGVGSISDDEVMNGLNEWLKENSA